VDFEDRLIRLTNHVKTPASAKPILLSEYAYDVLRAWKKEAASAREYVFPSPVLPNRPQPMKSKPDTTWSNAAPFRLAAQ
jgi:hypothetical protein